MRVTNPHRNARDARTRATVTRAEAEELRALPINDAARRIEAKQTERENWQQQTAERARQFTDPVGYDTHPSDPRRQGRGRTL